MLLSELYIFLIRYNVNIYNFYFHLNLGLENCVKMHTPGHERVDMAIGLCRSIIFGLRAKISMSHTTSLHHAAIHAIHQHLSGLLKYSCAEKFVIIFVFLFFSEKHLIC
jgi:hypothetical protein